MTVSDRRYIESFFQQLEEVIRDISRDDIERVINILFKAWQNNQQIFLIGNGGSAATASHLAADLNKVASVSGKPRLKAMSLVDNMPLYSALVNDEGWDNVFVEQLKNFLRAGDVVVAISVHGGEGSDRAGQWSQNLLKAVAYAREHGGTAVGLSGFEGGPLKQATDACVVVPCRSTAHVEAFHVILHHLIAFRLREKIEGA